MPGFIEFAPIYLNGVLALLFVLVLPGLVFVCTVNISNFAQRWLVVYESSLTANYLLVTLIAALGFNPLTTYRMVAAALVAALIAQAFRRRARVGSTDGLGASTVSLRDIQWFLFSLAIVGVTYLDVWRHGLPNIFEGGDVSYSWNSWALLWSQGTFPVSSLGYPQFVPTIWAVSYIFTGSTEQYFAFYIYIAWIVLTVTMTAINLGRAGWWKPLLFVVVLAWLVAEIRDDWLRSCLRQAYPDWVAAIFGYAGVALFVGNAPEGRFGREPIISSLLSLCLVSIAAATKPLYGLFVIAVLISICVDAARYLPAQRRNTLVIGAVALVASFVMAYVADYVHLAVVRAAPYPYSLSERLLRAANLFNSNFTLPFRLMMLAGLAVSPFVKRARWLSLPLIASVLFWAGAASYDLRNLLGLLLIGVFIPLFALARACAPAWSSVSDRSWRVADGWVATGVVVLCVAVTAPLARSDESLRERFAADQLAKSAGTEINGDIEQLLARGCTIFNTDNYLYTISAFRRFNDQLPFFHAGDPMTDSLVREVNKATGCTGFFYPPDRTHSSVLDFISSVAGQRNYTKRIDRRGMVLLLSDPGSEKDRTSAPPRPH